MNKLGPIVSTILAAAVVASGADLSVGCSAASSGASDGGSGSSSGSSADGGSSSGGDASGSSSGSGSGSGGEGGVTDGGGDASASSSGGDASGSSSGGDASGSSSGSSSGGDAGGDGGSTGSWVYTLPPFTPANASFAAPNAYVDGVWFSSLNKGVLSITGGGAGAGALIAMTGPTTTGSVLVDGSSNSATMTTGRALDFQAGLQVTSYGLVAPTEEDLLVASTNGGTSFTLTPTYLSGSDQLGWLAPIGPNAGWSAVVPGPFGNQTENEFSTTSNTFASNTTWTNDWSETSNPPCANFLSIYGYYRSGSEIVLTEATDQTGGLALCQSSNGGSTWNTIALPNAPADMGAGWDVGTLVFFDANHGMFLQAAPKQEKGLTAPFAYITSNGGSTWTASTLPAGNPLVAKTATTFTNAFYAPDGQHVWITGAYTPSPSTCSTSTCMQPLLYASTDGGATFIDISATLSATVIAKYSMPAGSFLEYWVPSGGFALDATHIWIGGWAQWDNAGTGFAQIDSFLAYSSTGGI